MAVISVRVDERTKERMKSFSYINWSEVIRRAIAERILEEETKKRRLNPRGLSEAVEITERVRRPSPGWSSTEEIRRWREQRK